ncbi:hypothetical protein BCEN4_480132 [Burkholderia cenocepacia]|nr:hypothetical protein BCEN4_480132 [Burkholderia cenocepacia]
MRRRPHRAVDAKMLLSSNYPRMDHAAGKVGPGGPAMAGHAARPAPARRVAGAGRGAPVVIGSFYGRHRRFLSPEKHAPGPGAARLKDGRAASVIPVQKRTHRPIRHTNVRFAIKLGLTFSIRHITLL